MRVGKVHRQRLFLGTGANLMCELGRFRFGPLLLALLDLLVVLLPKSAMGHLHIELLAALHDRANRQTCSLQLRPRSLDDFMVGVELPLGEVLISS